MPSNTGHLDIIEAGNRFSLTEQTSVNRIQYPAQILAGWGGPSVAGIIEQLERIYFERKAVNSIYLRGEYPVSQTPGFRNTDSLNQVVLQFAKKIRGAGLKVCLRLSIISACVIF